MISVLSKHFNPANHLLGAELGPQVKMGPHPIDEKSQEKRTECNEVREDVTWRRRRKEKEKELKTKDN